MPQSPASFPSQPVPHDLTAEGQRVVPQQVPPRVSAARLVVPDLARGLMLWGIAVANVTTAWVLMGGGEFSMTGRVVDGSLWDKIAIMFTTSFMHARGFPMFSTLLGFGVGLIAGSLYRRGYPLGAARGVLVRRYGMLALFGAAHMIFLFWGDIMLTYGLLGMLLAVFLRASSRVILWTAAALYTVACVAMVGAALLASALMGSEWLASSMGDGSPLEMLGLDFSSYLHVLLAGVTMLVLTIPNVFTGGFLLLPLMLLGFVAAREGVLADPVKHRRLLVWVAVVGIGVGVATGIPSGLEAIGVLNSSVFGTVSTSVGVLGGPGLIAALALALSGVQERVSAGGELPWVLRPLAALGKRSMTGYVLQSVLFLVVFTPMGLGLFKDAGAGLLLVVGTCGWLLTLLVAVALEAAGKPGPLEALHRRLSYGKSGLAQRWVPPQMGS